MENDYDLTNLKITGFLSVLLEEPQYPIIPKSLIHTFLNKK